MSSPAPREKEQRLRESLGGCEHLKEVDTNPCPASKLHSKPFSVEGRQGEYGCYLGSDGASVQGLLSPEGSLQEGWMEEAHVLGTPDLGSVCGTRADAGAGVLCFPKSCCRTIPPHCGLVSLSELELFRQPPWQISHRRKGLEHRGGYPAQLEPFQRRGPHSFVGQPLSLLVAHAHFFLFRNQPCLLATSTSL